MLQIIIVGIILLIVFIFAIKLAIKEIIHNPITIFMTLTVFIAFTIGGEIFSNIIISIVFEIIFITKLEMKSEREKIIIKKKLEKYNRIVNSYNRRKLSYEPYIHVLNFNEELYDMCNKFETFYWKLFIYSCINAPLVFWEIFIKILDQEEPTGNFVELFNDYYEYKISICICVLILTVLICTLILSNTKSEYYIISKLMKTRRKNIQVKDRINELYNGKNIFTDDEKLFIGKFSLDEIKILNKGKYIL